MKQPIADYTSLEEILKPYVSPFALQSVLSDVRTYYLQLISSELAEAKTASRLRQKIVRS